jgi:hypothetical protein
MTSLALRAAAIAALLVAASVPSQAGSLATSSAAGGSSASSATSAASDSSASSAKAIAQADGPYRVVDITPVPERPGTVRMTLQALAEGAAPDATLTLHVPQQALERGGVAAGVTVTASQRPYGVEFAHADTRRAFFLVLHEAFDRELRSNPVTL